MSHSQVGASSAHRWMACPGSVKLSEPYEDIETDYAKEGTHAHDLAEYRLRKATGQLEKGAIPVEPYDQAMSDYVDVYVNIVLAELNRCSAKDNREIKLHVEERVNINAVDPRLYGTVDAMFHCAAEQRTYIFDLKYGKGVYVDVEDNPQLLYYGLGAYHYHFPRTVKIHIIQPRLENVDFMLYSAADMENFEEKLTRALWEVDNNPDSFVPGEKQCKFCKAKGECPALATKYISMLTDKEPFEIELKNAFRMDLEDIGKIFMHKTEIISYLDALEGIATYHLKKGDHVRGCKLVERNGGGVWKDTKTKEARTLPPTEALSHIHGTPNQIAKLPRVWEEHCEKEYIAVPDSDKRAPVFVKPLDLEPAE